MTLAKRLRQAMQEAGYTQSSLAEKAGMAQSMIWKLLSGKAHSTSKILDLSKVLNVSPEWLADGEGVMRKSDNGGIEYYNMTPVHLYKQQSDSSGFYDTGDIIMIPDIIEAKNQKAFKIETNSGCIEAPAGTYIVVDPDEVPGTNDLVYARINDSSSVYRFVDGGADKYLSVDDPRVPLIPLSDVYFVGVITYLIRGLRRS